ARSLRRPGALLVLRFPSEDVRAGRFALGGFGGARGQGRRHLVDDRVIRFPFGRAGRVGGDPGGERVVFGGEGGEGAFVQSGAGRRGGEPGAAGEGRGGLRPGFDFQVHEGAEFADRRRGEQFHRGRQRADVGDFDARGFRVTWFRRGDRVERRAAVV